MDNTLLLGFTQDAARKAREAYRTALGVVLILEAAAGLSLLLWPASLNRILGDGAASTPWLRLCGVLLLIVAALSLSGRGEPSRSKILNLLGPPARLGLGALLIFAGGGLIFAGLAEIAAALALAQLYFKYFEAEVTTRP